MHTPVSKLFGNNFASYRGTAIGSRVKIDIGQPNIAACRIGNRYIQARRRGATIIVSYRQANYKTPGQRISVGRRYAAGRQHADRSIFDCHGDFLSRSVAPVDGCHEGFSRSRNHRRKAWIAEVSKQKVDCLASDNTAIGSNNQSRSNVIDARGCGLSNRVAVWINEFDGDIVISVVSINMIGVD